MSMSGNWAGYLAKREYERKKENNMKRSEAFPGNYLSKEDCIAPIVAVVASVSRETIKGDNGDETKPVVHFRGATKPLIINLVNWDTLEQAFGDDSDGWVGQAIELYVDPSVMFAGKRVGGVRVRIPAGRKSSPVNQTGDAPLSLPEAVKLCQNHGIEDKELYAFLRSRGSTPSSAAAASPTSTTRCSTRRWLRS
jgi:hypothetical protein